MSTVPENAPGLPLQDPDDVYGLNVVVILSQFVGLELPFVTLLGKLINPRLFVGRGP
jgi:hypothetical protein